MKLRSFNRFFVEAFQSLRRNLAMSIASIVTIALTLFVCGVFAVIVLNINHFAGEIESSVEVQVFMEDGLDETGRAALEEEIKDIDGVASLAFVSKDEALESMAARLGDTPQGATLCLIPIWFKPRLPMTLSPLRKKWKNSAVSMM